MKKLPAEELPALRKGDIVRAASRTGWRIHQWLDGQRVVEIIFPNGKIERVLMTVAELEGKIAYNTTNARST